MSKTLFLSYSLRLQGRLYTKSSILTLYIENSYKQHENLFFNDCIKCVAIVLYCIFFFSFFFVFCLWLGISRILKEPRKTIFALNTRRGFPAHSSNKAADWSLGRTLNGPNNRRKTLITIGWSVVCHWPWMCMVCVCFFVHFSFFYVLLPHQTTSAVSMKKMILW